MNLVSRTNDDKIDNPDRLVNPAKYAFELPPSAKNVSYNKGWLSVIHFDCGKCGRYSTNMRVRPIKSGQRLKLRCTHLSCLALNLTDLSERRKNEKKD